MHARVLRGQSSALQLPRVRKAGPLAGNATADASDGALRRTLLYMASRRGGGRGRLLRLGELEAMDVPEVKTIACCLPALGGHRFSVTRQVNSPEATCTACARFSL
jgi:hypothetical protein